MKVERVKSINARSHGTAHGEGARDEPAHACARCGQLEAGAVLRLRSRHTLRIKQAFGHRNEAVKRWRWSTALRCQTLARGAPGACCSAGTRLSRTRPRAVTMPSCVESRSAPTARKRSACSKSSACSERREEQRQMYRHSCSACP